MRSEKTTVPHTWDEKGRTNAIGMRNPVPINPPSLSPSGRILSLNAVPKIRPKSVAMNNAFFHTKDIMKKIPRIRRTPLLTYSTLTFIRKKTQGKARQRMF
jgi:hypothetical protein